MTMTKSIQVLGVVQALGQVKDQQGVARKESLNGLWSIPEACLAMMTSKIYGVYGVTLWGFPLISFLPKNFEHKRISHD